VKPRKSNVAGFFPCRFACSSADVRSAQDACNECASGCEIFARESNCTILVQLVECEKECAHCDEACGSSCVRFSQHVESTNEKREIAPFCVLEPTLNEIASCFKAPKTHDLPVLANKMHERQ
jgi:hypothetical protein